MKKFILTLILLSIATSLTACHKEMTDSDFNKAIDEIISSNK